MKAKAFLDKLDDQRIVSAIASAESKTSGEIRVYVADRAVADPVAAAQKQFLRLGMQRTRLRNGVLIYFAPRSQRFSIVGDSGIHEKCGGTFWTEIAEAMATELKQENFTDSVLSAVERVGSALAKHFPREPGDINELSNEIARD